MAIFNQKSVFGLLLNHFSKADLVKILVHNLHISRPTAYNYIDNKRSIPYDDLIKLFEDKELRPFLSKSNAPSISQDLFWDYQSNHVPEMNPTIFLNLLYENLSQLDPNKHTLKFISMEVPIFYYIMVPDLLSFKLFVWSQTVWNNQEFKEEKFHPSKVLNTENLKIVKKINELFSRIPSEEMWSSLMLDHTLNQLRYFRQLEWFENIRVYSNLKRNLYDLLNILRGIMQTGLKMDYQKNANKSNLPKAVVYSNEIYFANSTFIVSGDSDNSMFVALDNPNFMSTNNPKVIQKAQHWFDNMKAHSTLLTSNKELFRKKFFDRLDDKLFTFDQEVDYF